MAARKGGEPAKLRGRLESESESDDEVFAAVDETPLEPPRDESPPLEPSAVKRINFKGPSRLTGEEVQSLRECAYGGADAPEILRPAVAFVRHKLITKNFGETVSRLRFTLDELEKWRKNGSSACAMAREALRQAAN